MKTLLSFILFFCLLISCPLEAETNISDLSYNELIELKQKIEAEIVSRPEWQGVSLTIGCWRIGKDIPAGSYSITIKDPSRIGGVSVWGYASQDYSTNGGLIHNLLIGQKNGSIGRIELLEGWLLEVNYPVILKPAEGLDFH